MATLRSNSTITRDIKSSRGFTIVELIIVIVVVVVLATIAVLLYDNIATQAQDTSLKSDLNNAKDQLEIYQRSGDYPATAAELNGGQGFDLSQDTTVVSYFRKPYGYCVTMSNPEASSQLRIRSFNGDGKIEEGNCDPVITTLAGSTSTMGYADGDSTTARFKGNHGLAIDSNGLLYVSESFNRRIRTVTPTGDVSTFTGSGTVGMTDGTQFAIDGPSTTAEFSKPASLAFDTAGNLIVADTNGRYLRKVTPDGTVSTLINSATGNKIWLNRISGVAVDNADNIYAFQGCCGGQIYKVTPGGTVSVLAGSATAGFADGQGTDAQFGAWSNIAMGPDGNIYVADSTNRIRKVTPGGYVSTVAGTGTKGTVDGPVGVGQLSDPHGIAFDSRGYMYVTQDNNRLRIIAPDGTISTLSRDDGTLVSIGSQYWMGGGYDWNMNGKIVFDSKGVLYTTSNSFIVKMIL